jgi:uncharacterized protein YchJ
MKLGEALSTLKKEKSRLARSIALRKDHIYVEEGKQPPFEQPSFNVNKLSDEINSKIDTIRKLKIQVQQTNLATNVQGEKITLAEAIIKVNDWRSKIAHLSTLFDQKSSWLYRDKDQGKKIALLNEEEVEDEIEKLEIEKVQLDNKIQITNWTTELQ